MVTQTFGNRGTDPIEVGALVTFYGIAANVPCKVIAVDPEARRVQLRATATRGAYPRGHVFSASGLWLEAR